MPQPTVRKGHTDVKLTRQEFDRRYRAKFYDPLFEPLSAEIDRLADAAWNAYDEYTSVYWYQAPSVLKLMIDRLVCADGGNPDPTTTHGKKPINSDEHRDE